MNDEYPESEQDQATIEAGRAMYAKAFAELQEAYEIDMEILADDGYPSHPFEEWVVDEVMNRRDDVEILEALLLEAVTHLQLLAYDGDEASEAERAAMQWLEQRGMKYFGPKD